jgi:hypothetical protein
MSQTRLSFHADSVWPEQRCPLCDWRLEEDPEAHDAACVAPALLRTRDLDGSRTASLMGDAELNRPGSNGDSIS